MKNQLAFSILTSLTFVVSIIQFSCNKDNDSKKNLNCLVTKTQTTNVFLNTGTGETTVITTDLPIIYDENDRIITRKVSGILTDSCIYESGKIKKIFRLSFISNDPVKIDWIFLYSYDSNGKIAEVLRTRSTGYIEIDSLFYEGNLLTEVVKFKETPGNFPKVRFLKEKYEYYPDNNISSVKTYEFNGNQEEYLSLEEFYSDYGDIKNHIYGSFFPDQRKSSLSPLLFQKYESKSISGLTNFYTLDSKDVEINAHGYPTLLHNSPIEYICR